MYIICGEFLALVYLEIFIEIVSRGKLSSAAFFNDQDAGTLITPRALVKTYTHNRPLPLLFFESNMHGAVLKYATCIYFKKSLCS